MFRSYTFKNYIVGLTKSFIEDDDFKEVIENDFDSELIRIIFTHAVIETYEKRNLNVPANLAIGFKWFSEVSYTGISIQEIIDYNKEHNPLYGKYADDVEKYLMLA